MTDPVKALFARTTQGIKPGLDIITALLEALDNPHHRLAVVHVAGTNGKGSVCAMLEAVLRASGFKTGLYTSPHLKDFAERFRINGEPVPNARLGDYIRKIEHAADGIEESAHLRGATFFEISTAIAFQYFADESVDIAIIETGMGGRWDATNVVIPLVSVITHIDFDHTEFLGDTIEKIAAEKAGIIKTGRPVVSAPQSDEVMAVLWGAGEPVIVSSEAVSVIMLAAPHKVRIETQSRNLPPINLPLLGECQRENCAVAIATLEIMAEMLDFEPEYKRGLEAVSWPARFQTISDDPLVILDGAHNPAAARALFSTLKENCKKHQIGFIFGFLEDKESIEFVRILKPLVSKAWAVSIDAPRGMAAIQVAGQIRAAGVEPTSAEISSAWKQAREWAAAEPDRLICITGSLYLQQMLTSAGCAY
jgi:dihydrofolate synthase/folylpolyglutamate synthase